jgi:glycine/D-amino acid oxidase-like deaminating enzyme
LNAPGKRKSVRGCRCKEDRAIHQSCQDVVIIGGGSMGSAVAYYLMRAGRRLKVAVVEKDPTYSKASTALPMANARIQFSPRQNIQISQYAPDILETFEDDMRVGEKRPNMDDDPVGFDFSWDDKRFTEQGLI